MRAKVALGAPATNVVDPDTVRPLFYDYVIKQEWVVLEHNRID